MFYDPARYLAAPVDALKIWQGGMSFHGGVLGTAVRSMAFTGAFGIALLPMADVLAVATPFGLMLGRIANFINAELWGRPTDLLWGVIFPGHAAQACGQVAGEICARHPSQLYEAALEGLVLGAVLLWLALRRGDLGGPDFCWGSIWQAMRWRGLSSNSCAWPMNNRDARNPMAMWCMSARRG